MKLTNEIATRLANTSVIRDAYPMIDHIVVRVTEDDDGVYSLFIINMFIYLNDPKIKSHNIYEQKLDPHWLVDKYYVNLLKLAGIKKRDIFQIYIQVIDTEGNSIFNYA